MRPALQQYYLGMDRDVAAWVAAVIANGGAVSAPRAAIVGRFIAREKASGAWALTDDYWGLWAEGEAQALTSLKQLRLATVVAAPTFTADAGYAFNGTTQYVNTGFNPATHGIRIAGTSMRIGIYERTDRASLTAAAGSYTSITSGFRVFPRDASSQFGMNLASNTSFIAGHADSRGYTSFYRDDTTFGAYKNGSSAGTVVPSSSGSTLASLAMFIGASNSGGAAALFRASSLGFVSVGSPLTESQQLAHYNAVQAWATAVGAEV